MANDSIGSGIGYFAFAATVLAIAWGVVSCFKNDNDYRLEILKLEMQYQQYNDKPFERNIKNVR